FGMLSLEWVNDLAAQARLPEGATLTLVDEDGTVLVRFPDTKGWLGRRIPTSHFPHPRLDAAGDHVFHVDGLDGVDRLFAATSLTLDDRHVLGHVIVGMPR